MKRLPIGITLIAGVALWLHGDEPPKTGPQTEKRFPPLKVPAGFKTTLFACDPLIEYPSAICAGPRPGAVFVAIDYMTGLGTEITRRDEVRLVEDTDGDGYADKAPVFAKGFNSIMGLAYHNGVLFVMHAPFLTALRDTKGAGVADERTDLLSGLGLTPEDNPVRLHCANGVTVGHDSWLYLSMGDNGVNVPRPEGDRLVLNGGGILRCRPDGRDLHVFATGLRNIYDVALDAELNVFVRDNENDGGAYKVRVCHSFHGADHGYPYLYEERPDEALAPLADLGLGSSAGGVCYLERGFPAEYRGDLFFCEWGRSVVRYQPRRAAAGFGPVKEIEFAAGAADDPYGFKPTDIVVQSDGSMLVADWCDGQRPKRGRGRIYHIAPADARPAPRPAPKKEAVQEWLALLDSESYAERCAAQAAVERLGAEGRKALADALRKGTLGTRGRCHAVWIIARADGAAALEQLLIIAQADADPAVRAQAVRAAADLVDPVLTRHKLAAGSGDAASARRLAALGKDQDPRVVLEIVVALGRLRWPGVADWLQEHVVAKPDAALGHAAMQALRRSDNVPALLKLLDLPTTAPQRPLALRAVAESFAPQVVDGLIARLGTEKDAERRLAYADLLARVYRQPAPWKYWGYRPPPRPANTVVWERTEAIAAALDRLLADPERGVRVAVLRRLQREKVPVKLATLGRWLAEERAPERVAVLLASLREQPAGETRAHLDATIRDRQHSAANRLTALALLVHGLDATTAESLLQLAQGLEDGSVLAEALRNTSKFPRLAAAPLLATKLQAKAPEVRAAAIEALGELRADEGRAPVVELLKDSSIEVRRAAAGAAGKLHAKPAADLLLKLAVDADAATRRASLQSLRLLREPRVVPLAVAALQDPAVEQAALECLAEMGGPEQGNAVAELARRRPSADVLAAAVRVLDRWSADKQTSATERGQLDGAIAEIHGATGIPVRWRVSMPVATGAVAGIVAKGDTGAWSTAFASGTEARLPLSPKDAGADVVLLLATELIGADATPVEFLASSSGALQVWLNGQQIHRRAQPRGFQVDSDRFAATLAKGPNRLLVQLDPTAKEFHLRFRRKSAAVEHEKLTQAALTRGGNSERGRKLFADIEKSLCLKCHRLGDQGERIGPELSGVGSRFSRIYLVESILEPSRTLAPSFGSVVVALKNGKVLTGIKVAETDALLTLADNQGVKHMIPKKEIDEVQASPLSTMPEGLEKRFTEEEFVDLIAFLVSQKEGRGP